MVRPSSVLLSSCPCVASFAALLSSYTCRPLSALLATRLSEPSCCRSRLMPAPVSRQSSLLSSPIATVNEAPLPSSFQSSPSLAVRWMPGLERNPDPAQSRCTWPPPITELSMAQSYVSWLPQCVRSPSYSSYRSLAQCALRFLSVGERD